jgi:hypothetical protein
LAKRRGRLLDSAKFFPGALFALPHPLHTVTQSLFNDANVANEAGETAGFE